MNLPETETITAALWPSKETPEFCLVFKTACKIAQYPETNYHDLYYVGYSGRITGTK